MTAYALHTHGLPGHLDGAVAHLQQMRQSTGDGLQPPAPSPTEGQKRRSDTGAGTNCNGKQHPSRHGVVRSGSQMMDADASQKESRDRSIKPHNGRQISSCEKACTVRNGEDNAAAGQKKAQSQSVLESSQEESESESESASSSDGTDAEESGSDDVPLGGKQGTTRQPQHAAFERLDAIFSTPSSGNAHLKSRVGQASPAPELP